MHRIDVRGESYWLGLWINATRLGEAEKMEVVSMDV